MFLLNLDAKSLNAETQKTNHEANFLGTAFVELHFFCLDKYRLLSHSLYCFSTATLLVSKKKNIRNFCFITLP